MADNISYHPTDALSYDPEQPVYWDPSALQTEVTRVFEVCHGCRMCFKYCDSFPNLFRWIDDTHDGDVRKLTADQIGGVMDACFQCKLCEVQCPYTPRDGHPFQLDFPKLVHRWKAQEVKARGLGLRDRVLGDPNRLATLARWSFGLANVMNRVGLHRWFMEKLLGIHRAKQLPEFAGTPFERWAETTGKVSDPQAGAEVVLFPTCFVENNDPQIGRDTLEVMAANQVEVRCDKGFACCGMPAWEHGDLDTLRNNAAHNLAKLEPWVDAGAKVMVLQPSCAMVMRREYPKLVAAADRPRAEKVAAAVVDPSEHLWSLRSEARYNTAYKSGPKGAVAYHAPCHLRAQAIGFRGRDLMRKVPGVDKIDATMECCGHDGTYAMKVEGFEPSARIGKRAFDGMKAADAPVWVSDCALACLQFEQHAGVRPMHPMTFLARAHRDGGFDGGDR
ncbi:MAG: heterodisulfide reductase-related iron-sulfur binding cluster [Myxococcota bacterium]